MAGLGLLIGLGVKLFADGAYAISDMKSMSTPCGHLEDGSPYYMNRKGQRFAANGERMVSQTAIAADGTKYSRVVGERTGNVYMDRERTFQRKIDERNERNRKYAIENGKTAYEYLDRSLKFGYGDAIVTKEISTGKYIAQLQYDWSKKEFRKFYLAPNAFYSFQTIEGDEGILISKEEFEKLDVFICVGGHMTHGREEFQRDKRQNLI